MSQTTTYQWDEENRLIGVTKPDGTTESYTYSGDGQRRSKTVTAGGVSDVTKYVWDGQNVLQETDGAGNLKAHYTDYPGYWGGLSSVKFPQSTPSPPPSPGAQFNTSAFGSVGFNQPGVSADNGSRFYHFDQQASTRQLTDSQGQVTDQYAYRGFGEEVFTSGSTRNPLRFQGEVGIRRESNGLEWMRARTYDPFTGQFVSNDPIGFRGGDWNLRRFVGNNPVRWNDPWGLSCTCCNNYFAFAWCCDESCLGNIPTPRLPSPLGPQPSDPEYDPSYHPYSGGPPPTRQWPKPPPRPLPPSTSPLPPTGGWFGGMYGNCCGSLPLSRRCNSTSQTVDALDAACKQHDICRGPTVLGQLPWNCHKMHCDLQLCYAAVEAGNTSCRISPYPESCKRAAFQVALYYCQGVVIQ